MTTIAFDGKTLACDGRMTDQDDRVLTWKCPKIYTAGRILFGIAGDAEAEEAIKKWISGGRVGKPPTMKDNSVLLIEPDGRAFLADGRPNFVEVDVPCAIGSGRMHAQTAMDCGKTAEEAVMLAAKRDSKTGGDILCLPLNPPHPKKKHAQSSRRSRS